jgi:outer membrane receptor for ferrienterochelin and colicins
LHYFSYIPVCGFFHTETTLEDRDECAICIWERNSIATSQIYYLLISIFFISLAKFKIIQHKARSLFDCCHVNIRAPQVFDEDLHITQVGGEGMFVVNRDYLKEEKSKSFILGIDFGKQAANKLYQFSITGFFTYLDNMFTLEEPEPDFGSKEFFRSPNVYGSIRIDWNIPKFINIRTELIYTGSMKVPHFAGYIEEDILEKSNPFAVLNLTLSKKIGFIKGHSITFTATVYNLLDQFQDDLDRGIYRDAGYIYGPRFPRTFRLGLKYNF